MDPLATAGELNKHLQRDLDPDFAEQAVQLASGAVRAYCKWDLSEETTTLQAEGNGTVVCTLPTLNLTDVTEVRVDGIVLDPDPVAWSWTKKGQLYRAAGWPRFAVIDVDCTHGYNPVPDLVKLVVLDLSARQGTNPEGLVQATAGSVTRVWSSKTSDTSLSAMHERLLDRYAI